MRIDRIVNRANLKTKLALVRQAQLLERYFATLKERHRIVYAAERLSYDA